MFSSIDFAAARPLRRSRATCRRQLVDDLLEFSLGYLVKDLPLGQCLAPVPPAESTRQAQWNPTWDRLGGRPPRTARRSFVDEGVKDLRRPGWTRSSWPEGHRLRNLHQFPTDCWHAHAPPVARHRRSRPRATASACSRLRGVAVLCSPVSSQRPALCGLGLGSDRRCAAARRSAVASRAATASARAGLRPARRSRWRRRTAPAPQHAPR